MQFLWNRIYHHDNMSVYCIVYRFTKAALTCTHKLCYEQKIRKYKKNHLKINILQP